MRRFLLLGLLWLFCGGVSGAAPRVIVVAADGTGQFRTVQEAVDSIPENNPTRVTIQIKPGVYKGHVRVPREKPRVTFRGENAEKTVLTNDWYASLKKPDGKEYGTSGSASVLIEGDDFMAENITFENAAGKTAGQAVAIRVMSDRCVFRKCRFLGWQDTLYANGKGRQYYRDCHIEGHVDFIFGSAAAVFENCTIRSKSSGYVTAHSRTEPNAPLGYVFYNCAFTASPEVEKVFLGRPWRPYARVVLVNCRLDGHIRPEGWDNWRNPANESTAWYAEYNSTGPGADPSARVSWSRQLTKTEAEPFHTGRFLARDDNWNPTMTYLFTSFRGNGEDGLHLAWSEDGYTWTDLGRSFLAPAVGVSKLMRDPSLLLAPDGTFHMVWTSGWTEKGIGYASSRDLIKWSEQRYFEVMAYEPTTMNTWAPELTYDEDAGEYLLYWSSTIPTRYPGDDGHQKGYNHRQYFATTRDFKTLSPTRLFYEPGHSVIDGVLVRRGSKDWVFVFKDERRDRLHLRAAFAPSPRGPFMNPTEPFTAHRTEGPSVLRIGDEWFIYFDIYGNGRYGAVKTKDFKTFTDITAEVSFPKGHRHGTVLTVPRAVVENLSLR